jgi:hypothetical protein
MYPPNPFTKPELWRCYGRGQSRRKFEYRSGEVYALIMAQPGFSWIGGAAVRRAMRASGGGVCKVTFVGNRRPSQDGPQRPKHWAAAAEPIYWWGRRSHYVTRWSTSCICQLAHDLEFKCPTCGRLDRHPGGDTIWNARPQPPDIAPPYCSGIIICWECWHPSFIHTEKVPWSSWGPFQHARNELRRTYLVIKELEREANDVHNRRPAALTAPGPVRLA